MSLGPRGPTLVLVRNVMESRLEAHPTQGNNGVKLNGWISELDVVLEIQHDIILNLKATSFLMLLPITCCHVIAWGLFQKFLAELFIGFDGPNCKHYRFSKRSLLVFLG